MILKLIFAAIVIVSFTIIGRYIKYLIFRRKLKINLEVIFYIGDERQAGKIIALDANMADIEYYGPNDRIERQRVLISNIYPL